MFLVLFKEPEHKLPRSPDPRRIHLRRLDRRKVHETFPPHDGEHRSEDVDDRGDAKAEAERYDVLCRSDGVTEGGGDAVNGDEGDGENDGDDVFHGVSPLFLFWFKGN